MVAEGEDLLSLDKPALCSGHERYHRPCDVMDGAGVRQAMRAYAPNRVTQLVARTDLEEREGLRGYPGNIQGTTNVLNAIRAKRSVERAAIASSSLGRGHSSWSGRRAVPMEEGVAATLAWLEAQPSDDQPAREKLLRPVP